MLYFILYLFLEVLLSVNISSYLGGLITFLEIMFSAFLGIVILINFKSTFRENLTAVSYNCIDLHEFQRLNIFTLLGAILLILPGFLTDILGMFMQFNVFTSMIVNRYGVKSQSCKTDFQKNNIQKDSNVIDVEIISEPTSIK
jgi:2-isopropylmalate synthase/UPF0716 protein FxsA